MARIFDSEQGFGALSQLTHWVTALAVAALFGLGWYMVELELSPRKLELYALHKSMGLSVLLLTVLRLGWRLGNPTPNLLGSPPRWQRRAARAAHAALYLLLLALPCSGWMLSSAADFPIVWFGLYELPYLTEPDDALRERVRDVHAGLGWALAAVLGLHSGAALKHHFVDRDATLQRMLPGAASRG